MAVAVSLGATAFDFTSLIKEQQRLSKQLLVPVPKSQVDPTQPLKYQSGGLTFDTYIKVFEPNSSDPAAKPTYRLYYRDNNNVEQELTQISPGQTLGGLGVGTTYSIYFDLESGQIQFRDAANAVQGVPGTVQFEAASGLTLASVNRRLADINTAIEAMSRVMAVANGATEGVQGLLR